MNFNSIAYSILKLLITSIITFSWVTSFAQIGGLYTYDFLNLNQSARTTALGGYTISISDEDIAQGYSNPALLNKKMKHHLSINHNFHLADISHGFVAYGLHLGASDISMMVGLNYVDYGTFERADIFGNRIGTFEGSETALAIGLGKQLDERLRIGLNLKYVNSNFDTYQSNGIGFDLGFHFYNPIKESNWSLVAKNIGGQLSSFNLERENFPLDIQFGYAKKLAHLPFQIMITAHHLQQWNLRSNKMVSGDPILIGQPNQEPGSLSKGIDNLFRHLAFGGEFLIGKNEIFRLRFGYNHLRNKELSVSGFRSLSGFSFGFGLKVKKIRIDYGLGRFHLAGGLNHLSLTLDMNSIFDKL